MTIRTRPWSVLAVGVTAFLMSVSLQGCADEDEDADAVSSASSAQGSQPTSAATAPTQSPQQSDPGVVETPVPSETPSTEDGDQSSVIESLPGRDDSECVTVSSPGAVRSGNVAIDVTAVLSAGSQTAKSPILVIPRRAVAGVSATVRLTGADGTTSVARSQGRDQAGDVTYLPVLVSMQTPSPWQLHVRVNGDEGCFTVQR